MNFLNFLSFSIGKGADSKHISQSNYISRDLSWLKFNYRVVDQAKIESRSIPDRLKFLAIAASNLDEFFMIRVGSLYNYLDYKKERIDYSGLKVEPFKKKLFSEVKRFVKDVYDYYNDTLSPIMHEAGINICSLDQLTDEEKKEVESFYSYTVHPMLTPMLLDSYHTFPVLGNKVLTFGIVTMESDGMKESKKLSFVQLPQNLTRFYTIIREGEVLFIPIEEIIRTNIHSLFRNVEIESVNLFRIVRNGDFSVEESDDTDNNFIEEIKQKIKNRKTGRVVRVDIEENASDWMLKLLMERWDIDHDNIIELNNIIDITCLWQIVKHPEFRGACYQPPAQVKPLSFPKEQVDIFEYLKKKDVLIHHPYNSMEVFMQLLESAAEDPHVLAIKITIYRLAKDSRITQALYKAAELGKHVSVLFEVKARFDEENNIKQAQWLQKAGCFVIYGLGSIKTHSKLCLIVRKEPESDKITRYVHMSSGNYNEVTSKLYTDVSLLTTNEIYGNDVSEFFNVVTGHSQPPPYQYLIAAPHNMREQLIDLVKIEIENAKNGLASGIVIKINSLQDLEFISALYEASNAGVPIKLIVRGICCLRPGRKGLSENISVKSIVGEFLEHARLFYFHQNGNPKVYGGSADAMVRSFDRRVESLFLIADEQLKRESINILYFNLKDNVNSYWMNEEGEYEKSKIEENQMPFDLHKEFYRVSLDKIDKASLF
ncbi:MAG: polyphosphate kinase 1 [Cytophagales bacterium]